MQSDLLTGSIMYDIMKQPDPYWEVRNRNTAEWIFGISVNAVNPGLPMDSIISLNSCSYTSLIQYDKGDAA